MYIEQDSGHSLSITKMYACLTLNRAIGCFFFSIDRMHRNGVERKRKKSSSHQREHKKKKPNKASIFFW